MFTPSYLNGQHNEVDVIGGFEAFCHTDDIEILRDKLYHFHIAIKQSPVATAITDVNGRILFVNQQFLKITGYCREELLGNTPAMIKSGLTPEYVYQQMWQTLRAGKVWCGELLNRKKNGELYWEREVITPVKNRYGETVSFVAVKEDITVKKHQESELRLLATAFETGQATLITDAEMTIEKVNQAFTDITGYLAGEVVGKTPKIFKSGRHQPMFYCELWETLLATGHWEGEIWNRNKYGDIYPIWQSITAVYDEFGKIRNYVAVFHDISNRKRFEQELERQALQDHLTGLGNRRAFDEAIRQAIRQAEQENMAFSLIIFDIDHFKSVNDKYGHEVGDAILKQLAVTAGQCLRSTDMLSRWGGEEFTILLPHTSGKGTEVFAERLRRQVAESRFQGLSVTISLGVTQYRARDDINSMMTRADEALYQAKRSGRNSVVVNIST